MLFIQVEGDEQDVFFPASRIVRLEFDQKSGKTRIEVDNGRNQITTYILSKEPAIDFINRMKNAVTPSITLEKKYDMPDFTTIK